MTKSVQRNETSSDFVGSLTVRIEVVGVYETRPNRF